MKEQQVDPNCCTNEEQLRRMHRVFVSLPQSCKEQPTCTNEDRSAGEDRPTYCGHTGMVSAAGAVNGLGLL